MVRCVQNIAGGKKLCKNAACCGTKYCNIHIPDCPICMNKLSPSGGEGESTVTKCGHHFHASCLNKWIEDGRNTQCPLCRERLIKPTLFVSMSPPELVNKITPTILRPILKDFYDRGMLPSNYIEISLDETNGSIIAIDLSTGTFIGTIQV